MPGTKGKYSLTDVAEVNGKPMGKYTAADVAPDAPVVPQSNPNIGGGANLGGVGNAINNFEDATIGTHTDEGIIKGFTQGIPHMIMHPIDSANLLGRAMIGAHTDTANDAANQMKQPGINNKIIGAGRYVQSGIPMIGPQLDKAGQQLQSGDVSGGIGTTLGVGSMIAGPKMGEVIPRGVETGVKGTVNWLGQRIVKGTPEQLITRATKPTVGLPEYENSVRTALPELAKHNPKSLSGLAGAADKVKAAKNAEFNQLRDKVSAVDTTPAADLQDASLPARYKMEDVAGLRQKALEQKGLPYRGVHPMPAVDATRIGTNAELRDFFNKSGGDQQAALQNPETARIHGINTGLRNAQYDAIKGGTGIDPRPIQDMFGHAVDIGDTAARRNTVFSRQQPVPLVSQIAGAHASPTGFALSKVISSLNDSDALVKRAFGRYNRNISPPSALTPNRMRLVIAGPGKLNREDDER